MQEQKIRAHVLVEGRVQGVFFRAGTRARARKHGVSGWVKNLPDGRVEAVLEGKKTEVEEMIRWMRDGPPGARVDKTEVGFSEYEAGFEDFQIRY